MGRYRTNPASHLAWAKFRARLELSHGDLPCALAAMVNTLRKWKQPLYPYEFFAERIVEGMALVIAHDAAGLGRWIEEFCLMDEPLYRALSTTRYEHLFTAKARAVGLVDQGDLAGAVDSLLAELGQWREPLYTADYLTEQTMRMQDRVRQDDAAGLCLLIEAFR